MWRNIGNFIAYANSNCFSKYLVLNINKLERSGKNIMEGNRGDHYLLYYVMQFKNKTEEANAGKDLDVKIAHKISSKRILLLNFSWAEMKPVIVQSTFSNCNHLA